MAWTQQATIMGPQGVPGPPGDPGTPGTPGATTFQALTDAADYSAGVAGQFVRVNAGGTGLEYVAGGATDTEAVQDIVGAMMTDTSEVNFIYNDATGTVTAVLLTNSIAFVKLATMPPQRLLGNSGLSTSGVVTIALAPSFRLESSLSVLELTESRFFLLGV